MVKLLIVSHEPVGAMMAGPAIRCLELARALAPYADVALAVPEAPDQPFPGLRLAAYQRHAPDSLVSLAREADAILISGYLLEDFPALGQVGRPLIVDVYDPFPVENLELHRGRPLEERMSTNLRDFGVLGRLLQAGDFFLCGSEWQRDFWLGMLAASGRLNPLTHQDDPSFRKLIDVVSMGIPETPPVAACPVKGVYPGIEPGDFLAVWPGGAWDWLDPLAAVEAVDRLSHEAPDIKLVFLGLRHPHPERVGAMQNPGTVIARAQASGLLGKQVFFNDWTPYQERARYLLDADVALTLHRGHLESRLAVRVRLLDCLWTGTPVVSTQGDVLAEAMAQRGLAVLVPPGDPAAVAEALMKWRSGGDNKGRLAGRFQEMAADYSWPAVCLPLVDYLRQPGRAPDHLGGPGPGGEGGTAGSSSLGLEGSPEPLRALAEAQERLRERELELAAARELLDRIARGKAMRLMNAARSAWRWRRG